MRLSACLLALAWSSPALAGVALVPGPPLPGDGETLSTVRFYVDSGARVRVKADAGKVGTVTVGEDGVVTVQFTAPAVIAAGKVAFKVSGGGEDATIDVPVAPPLSGGIELTFDPPVLASTGTATVRIKPTRVSPVGNEARRFQLVASTGTLDPAVPAGDGTWVARYTPPKGLTAPIPVVVAVADAAAPTVVYGQAVLPVTVKRNLTIDAKPGSSNVLQIGSRRYGPVVAAPSGKAAFDVELDPREPQAGLQSVNPDTSTDERKVPLPVTAKAQIAFLPGTPVVPADPQKPLAVRFVAVGSDGTPLTATAPRIVATRGTIEPARWENGLYVANFTPPATAGEAVLSVEAEGVKVDKRIQVVGTLPTISVTSDPPFLDAKATTFQVVARVKDASGTSLPGRVPAFGATGATIVGAPKDNGDGSYTTSWKLAQGSASAMVWASPSGVDATGLPAARLVAWTSTAVVTPGGQAQLVVVPVDALGLPVPNVDLRLGVPKGDGTLPPTAKTDARGIARVTYKAGSASGLGGLRIEGAGLVTELPIFQGADGVGPALAPSGDPASEALRLRWQAAAPEVWVARGAPPPPVVVAAPAAPTATGPAPTVVQAPAATGPAPAAPAAPRASARPAKAPRATSSDAPPQLRVGGALLNSRGGYTQESDGGAQLVGEASFDAPPAGFWGLAASAAYLPMDAEWGRLGVDVRARAQLEPFEILGSSYVNLQRDVVLGALYRRQLAGPLGVQGSLGAHYTTGVVFWYSDAQLTEAELVNKPVYGGRLGAAATLDVGPVAAVVELAETFAPYPVDTHAEALLDIAVSDAPTALRLGATWDRRSMRFETDLDEGGEASVLQKQWSILAGVSVAIP